MNQSQQKFHDFFLERVQPGREADAEAMMTESFAHQDDGTFTPDYLATITTKMMALLRPECVAEFTESAARMRATMAPTQLRVVSASRTIAASPAEIFELIADPARQPEWDGNDNLAQAAPGQRVRGVGDVFTMTLTGEGAVRENHVVEFEEGRCIAWKPAPVGKPTPGHLWRWELEPLDDGTTRVTHTYDWTGLTDETRMARARATKTENLEASLTRLAALAENRPAVAR